MKRYFFGYFLALHMLAFTAIAAPAQARVVEWIQVEAQPSLRDAQTRTRAYASHMSGVAGFAIEGGWYAIVLGPYSPADARARLQNLRLTRQIPQDSFIADGINFGQQFWPIGAMRPSANTAINAPAPAPGADAPAIDETLRQARQSESLLSGDARKTLQAALAWGGFYGAAIDGAFGRGTRRSMVTWQNAHGYPATGILTSRQRRELLDAYNVPLKSVGMQTVRDAAAGIVLQIPGTMVGFTRYLPPFAYYDSKPGSRARVFLISETGDRAALYSLYDVLQTLKIIPSKGVRKRSKNSFEINGTSDTIHSYAYARAKNGLVKGFILVWPTGDEKRRKRVLAAMRASFSPFGDALGDSVAQPDYTQRTDLVSGLEIRKPAWSRSGFYVTAAGDVLTTAKGMTGCRKITLDNNYEAGISARNAALGVVLLTPKAPLSPPSFATFRAKTPRLNTEIAVAGYSYQGVLDAPTLTFGTLTDIRGLNGENNLQRLRIMTEPGDAGGPVYDASGLVQAMLLPRANTADRRLPEDVHFAASAPALDALMAQDGATLAMADDGPMLAPEDLATKAQAMTVLVSCWK